MKLHLTQAENSNLITAYASGFVDINQQRYERNLIIMADKLILDWSATDFNSLTAQDFIAIADLNPEVVLLGNRCYASVCSPQAHGGTH